MHLRKLLLGVLIALTISAAGESAPSSGPLVAVELETFENTLDGCGDCGCRTQAGIEPGRKQEAWLSVGVVRQAGSEWEAVASSSHCGSGPFDRARENFTKTIGIPYVILDLSTTPEAAPSGSVLLKCSLRLRKLSGFDKQGRPVYDRSGQDRLLTLEKEGEILIPLLAADQHEEKSFRIHEVVARLRGTVLGRGPAASYGTISVTADIPGAEILLDGGFAGRSSEATPAFLRNVPTGKREIRVRDFSGREAKKQVEVVGGGTVEADLRILSDASRVTPGDLLPIGKNPQGQEEYWRARDGAMVVKVPAGEFLMGSAEGQGDPPERPRHRLNVPDFLIDKTEVSWRQYRKFAEHSGKPLPPAPVWGSPDDYAVSNVLWEEAAAYCQWVGGRLPTEAEWEKAARGTDGRAYPWGDSWDQSRCNSRDGGPHRPESIGTFRSCLSPYGVLDLAGSVWEWCADWYGETFYSESPAGDPQGPSSGTLKVLRGGCWMSASQWLRSAFRYKADPTWRNVHFGFRCARNLQE